MDLVPVLSTIVLVATLATLVLGVLSYVAFRSRERRSPSLAAGTGSAKQFFVRLTLHDEGPTPAQ